MVCVSTAMRRSRPSGSRSTRHRHDVTADPVVPLDIVLSFWHRRCMQIAVLGSGMVGQALGGALTHRGHEVALGSRSSDNAAARRWAGTVDGSVRTGSFADAVRGADVIINATAGMASLSVLTSLPRDDVDGTVLLDVANPLDFSAGMPPTLSVSGGDSLAEQIQRALPSVRVVKALNTMAAAVMVEPSLLRGQHHVFVSGDDAEAKTVVTGLLTSFGWPERDILDLGPLETARGTEALLPLWLRVWAALGTPLFNIAVIR